MAEPKRTERRQTVAKPAGGQLPDRVEKAITRARWRAIPQLVSKIAYVPWKEYQDRPPTKREYAAWANEYPYPGAHA